MRVDAAFEDHLGRGRRPVVLWYSMAAIGTARTAPVVPHGTFRLPPPTATAAIGGCPDPTLLPLHPDVPGRPQEETLPVLPDSGSAAPTAADTFDAAGAAADAAADAGAVYSATRRAADHAALEALGLMNALDAVPAAEQMPGTAGQVEASATLECFAAKPTEGVVAVCGVGVWNALSSTAFCAVHALRPHSLLYCPLHSAAVHVVVADGDHTGRAGVGAAPATLTVI